jgi:TatD DNase family protein
VALPWIDTHCHLDAGEFDADRSEMLERVAEAGIEAVVIPAVNTSNFAVVKEIAAQALGGRYALGIHPLCSAAAGEQDLALLDAALGCAKDDQAMVAVGEIGLDLFVEELKTEAARHHQEWLFEEQLRLALHHKLPVLVHIRRAQDRVLRSIRRYPGVRGIAHAFNGSQQQADMFIDLGFKLGVGGAMTFERALNIRRLAAHCPLEALVLETDSPDISPAWLNGTRNTPCELPAIGQVLGELRGLSVSEVAVATAHNAHQVLPRL